VQSEIIRQETTTQTVCHRYVYQDIKLPKLALELKRTAAKYVRLENTPQEEVKLPAHHQIVHKVK